MKRDRQSLVHSLLESNETFKHLYEQHRDLDLQVREFDKKIYLNSEQQMEVARLKKLKLKNKDQMEAIISSHEPDRLAAAGAASTGT